MSTASVAQHVAAELVFRTLDESNLATAYLTHVCTWKWQRIGGDQPGFPAPALTCCRVSTVFSCHR